MYYIRKCQITTIKQTTDVAKIDPTKFEKFGYFGDSESEFLEFLSENTLDLSKLDQETKNELVKIYSYNEGFEKDDLEQESWIEIGEVNQDGLFESTLNTFNKKYDF